MISPPLVVVVICWVYAIYAAVSKLYDDQAATTFVVGFTTAFIAYVWYKFNRENRSEPVQQPTVPQGPTLEEKVNLLRADIDKLLAAQSDKPVEASTPPSAEAPSQTA